MTSNAGLHICHKICRRFEGRKFCNKKYIFPKFSIRGNYCYNTASEMMMSFELHASPSGSQMLFLKCHPRWEVDDSERQQMTPKVSSRQGAWWVWRTFSWLDSASCWWRGSCSSTWPSATSTPPIEPSRSPPQQFLLVKYLKRKNLNRIWYCQQRISNVNKENN